MGDKKDDKDEDGTEDKDCINDQIEVSNVTEDDVMQVEGEVRFQIPPQPLFDPSDDTDWAKMVRS